MKGTQFWIGCMDNNENAASSLSEDIRVYISAEQFTIGNLSVPGHNFNLFFSIQPDSTIELSVPTLIAEHLSNETIDNKAIRIESSEDVTVSVLSYQEKSSDATPVLPDSKLGMEYIVGSFKGPVNGYRSELLIIATANNTVIDITPADNTLSGRPASLTYSITLDEGDSYQLKAEDLGDITGSVVSVNPQKGACSPIAVFSGVECARVPFGCTFCDHLYQQNIPVNYWGTDFVLAPFQLTSRYSLRILAGEDNTLVSVNGASPAIINRGQFSDLAGLSTTYCITADKPIQVIQFMEGNTCAGNGDPAMIFLAPMENAVEEVQFRVQDQTLVTNHFINISVATSSMGSVMIDGQLINPSLFQLVSACNQYATVTIPISVGTHKLSCSQGLVANLYGLGTGLSQPESYALVLGAHFPEAPKVFVSENCGTGPFTLNSNSNLQNGYWFGESYPTSILGISDSLVLNAPATTDVYVYAGQNISDGCTEEEYHLVESTVPIGLDIDAAKIVLCRYEETELIANVNNDSANYVFEWFTQGGDQFGDTNRILFRPASTQWVYCRVSAIGNGQCIEDLDSVLLAVQNAQLVSAQTESDQNNYCVGDTIELTGEVLKVVWFDEANSGVSLWPNAQGVVSSSLLGSINGSAFVFSGGTMRELETPNFDFSDGGLITFYLNIRDSSLGVDMPENTEEVLLEYTLDSGTTWITFQTFYPWAYDGFTKIEFDLPNYLKKPSVGLRWVQPSFSGGGLDVWALEDILIATYDTTGFSYSWSPSGLFTNDSVLNTQAIPDSLTNVTLTITDSLYGCTVTDTITLRIGKHFNLNSTNDTLICDANGLELFSMPEDSGNYTFFWQPAEFVSDPFSSVTHANLKKTEDFVVSVTSEDGCIEYDTIKTTVNFLTELVISASDTAICIGDTIQFTTSISETFLNDDFDPIQETQFWTEIAGAAISSLCGSVSGNALYFNGGTDRFAETIDLNTINGGTLSFMLIRGSGFAPCDAVDGNDPIHFEYSNDGGATWIAIFDSIVSGFTFFTNVTVPIPAGAQTPSTRFRWRQSHWDGEAWDHWALENIVITSVSNPNDFTFDWSPSASVSSDTIQNPKAFPSATTIYELSLTDITGCVVKRSQRINTGAHFAITVPSDTTICTIDGMQAFVNTSNSNIQSYVWGPEAYVSDTSISNPTLNPIDTTDFRVKVTSDSGCTEYDTFTVFLPPPIVLKIDASATSICIGDSIIMEAQVENDIQDDFNNGLDSSQWATIFGADVDSICGSRTGEALRFSGESVRLISTIALNTIAGGSIDFWLKYANGATLGCEDVDAGEFVTLEYSLDLGLSWTFLSNVPLNNLGIFSNYNYNIPNAARSNQTMFRWRQVSFNSGGQDNWSLEDVHIRSGSDASRYGYLWNQSTGLTISDSINPQITVLPAQQTFYFISILDSASGCVVSDTIKVNAGVTFNTFPDSDTLKCFADPVLLSVFNDYSGDVSTTWSPAVYTNQNDTTSTFVNPTSTTNFSIESVSDSGCIKTDQILVVVTPEIVSNLSVLDTGICRGDSILIQSVPAGGNGKLNFSWFPTTGIVDTTSLSILALPSQNITYYLSLRDSATACAVDDSVQIRVGAKYTVTPSNDSIVCQSTTLSLDAGHDYIGGMSYEWSPDTLVNKVFAKQTLAFVPDSTVFHIRYESDSGCTIKDSIMIALPDHFNVGITASPSDTICVGGDLTLYAEENISPCDEYNTESISYAPISGVGAPILVGNEGVTGAFPIGFDFRFFCEHYDEFYLSSNGFITFSDGQFHGCCQGGLIPTAAEPNNFIAYAWSDLEPLNSGSMDYFVTDTAPNRVFVLNIRDVTHGLGSGDSVSLQLQLYEGSNEIQIHTLKMESDGSLHTMGIENKDGSEGLAYPGRNASSWNTTMEGVRFYLSDQPDQLSYTWSPAVYVTHSDPTGKAEINPLKTGYFHAYGLDSVSGCVFKDSILIVADTTFSLTVPSDQILCNTDQHSINVSSSIPGVNVSWEPAFLLNDPTSFNPMIIKDTTATYLITAIDTLTKCLSQESVTIAKQIPEVLTISPDTAICQGGIMPLSVSGGSIYDWSPDASLFNDSTAFVLAVPNTSTTYTVSSIDWLGCKVEKDVFVRVDSNLQVNLGNDASICEGDSIVFDAGQGFITYTWQDGSDQQSITADSVGKYYVEAKNQCLTSSDTVLITSLISPFVFDLGNDTGRCENEVLQIGISQPLLIYKWSSGESVALINADSGLYSLLVTDAFGCTYSDSIFVDYWGLPTAALPSTKICLGDSAQVVLDSTVNYLWSPNLDISDITSHSPYFYPEVTRKYFVNMIDTNACKNNDSLVVVLDSVPINFLPDTFRYCPGSVIGIGPVGTYNTYLWSTGADSKQILVNKEDEFWLNVVGDCGSSTDSTSVVERILIAPNVADVHYVCDQDEVAVEVTNPEKYKSFSWEVNGDVLVEDTNGVLLARGNYELRTVDLFNCELVIPISVETGFGSVVLPNIFSPNDDLENDTFKLISYDCIESFQIQIFNRWGTKVYESNDPNFEWNDNSIVDGTYFYSILLTNSFGNNSEIKGWVQVVK